MDDLFRGKLVRLTAENPEVMAGAFSRWAMDTEYFRLLDSDPPRLYSEKKWKEWLEKDLEHLQNAYPSDLFFSIRTLEDDRLIGFTGFFDLYWQQGDSLIAIALGDRADWGKGYGTDAMRLMLRYAFTELNLRRVTLIVFEYNPRAIRSYEKAGFVMEGRIRRAMQREGKRWDFLFMGVLREDWERENRS
jgi:RimJ/RimL family protein N-acetyltransferase